MTHSPTRPVSRTSPCKEETLAALLSLQWVTKAEHLLCPIKHNGLDLATLSEERLQLLVVEKSIGRDMLQLQNTAGISRGGPRAPESHRVHRAERAVSNQRGGSHSKALQDERLLWVSNN